MKRDVSDQQASMLSTAMSAQRAAIVVALEALAAKLTFARAATRDATRPDVVREKQIDDKTFLFVGHAKGYTEPAHDERHHEDVRITLRRFARRVNKRRGKGATELAGGYVMVGTYDAAEAYAWASILTTMARPHRIHRDGALVRFVVCRLGRFWMAC